MARPPKPTDEVRSQVLQLRLTVGEREAMESGAERAGEQLTQFIRNAALERAAKVGRRAGKGNAPRKPQASADIISESAAITCECPSCQASSGESQSGGTMTTSDQARADDWALQ